MKLSPPALLLLAVVCSGAAYLAGPPTVTLTSGMSAKNGAPERIDVHGESGSLHVNGLREPGECEMGLTHTLRVRERTLELRLQPEYADFCGRSGPPPVEPRRWYRAVIAPVSPGAYRVRVIWPGTRPDTTFNQTVRVP